MGLEGDSARQRQQQVQRVRSKTSGTFQKVGKQKSRGRTIGILVGRGQTPDGIRSQRTLNIHEHECKHTHACTHAHTHTQFLAWTLLLWIGARPRPSEHSAVTDPSLLLREGRWGLGT